MSRGKWNRSAVLWTLLAEACPSGMCRWAIPGDGRRQAQIPTQLPVFPWLRHLTSRRDALHAVKTDRFANADAFEAVAQKALHFAGSARSQHSILFQAPEGVREVRLIFWRLQYPADLMLVKKKLPSGIGLQHRGVHLPTITRVANEK